MPFKIADDPETDYRELVRTAYNRCAMDYAGQRRTTPEAELNLITKHLIPERSLTLDVVLVSRSHDILQRHSASLGSTSPPT